MYVTCLLLTNQYAIHCVKELTIQFEYEMQTLIDEFKQLKRE